LYQNELYLSITFCQSAVSQFYGLFNSSYIMATTLLIENATFNRIMGICCLGFQFLYVGKSDNHLITLTVQSAGLLQTNYV